MQYRRLSYVRFLTQSEFQFLGEFKMPFASLEETLQAEEARRKRCARLKQVGCHLSNQASQHLVSTLESDWHNTATLLTSQHGLILGSSSRGEARGFFGRECTKAEAIPGEKAASGSGCMRYSPMPVLANQVLLLTPCVTRNRCWKKFSEKSSDVLSKNFIWY